MKIVIYKSIYGTTEQYAQWLAEMLDCQAVKISEAKKIDLSKYDTIIFGGGLYAGGIGISSLLNKSWKQIKGKKIVVFTVGTADPSITDYSEIISRVASPDKLKSIMFFHLRGAMDYSKMSFLHRMMMAMLKFVISRKKEVDLTITDKGILASYGKSIDFMNRDTLLPIVEYLK